MSSLAGRLVAVGDVDGDGHPDTARLIWVNQSPMNWRLTVYLSSGGRPTVGFAGFPLYRGALDAPTFAGSTDADRDGHAEIFVKTTSGASTQFWSIFKLIGRQLVQVTVRGQPISLPVNGSVTHQGGFRCDGHQFIETSAGSNNQQTTTYEWDTYVWDGSHLTFVSRRTGTTTLNGLSAYGQVKCGNLPGYAPLYTGPWPSR